MRRLYVGDPHAKVEDLDDCQVLMDQAMELAQKHGVPEIVILGDLHHNHALVHTDIIAFWQGALDKVRRAGYSAVLLVGNHDQPGDESSRSHALLAYADMSGVTVVDRPMVLHGILHLPYYHCAEDFVAACRANPSAKVVVCHQEFNGTKYENGFYSKGGVEPADIPQEQVIAGHIHGPQKFGKVDYLGSPRWLASSDANAERFLYVVEHDDDGLVQKPPLTVASVCRRIIQLVDTPENPIASPEEACRDQQHQYLVDIAGPADWLTQRLPLYAGRAKVRATRTDLPQAKVRESEGLGQALNRYLAGWKSGRGVPRERLERMVHERVRL